MPEKYNRVIPDAEKVDKKNERINNAFRVNNNLIKREHVNRKRK